MPGQIRVFEGLLARFHEALDELANIPMKADSRARRGVAYAAVYTLENGEVADWARQTRREAEAGDEEARLILGELILNEMRDRLELRGVGMPYEWTLRGQGRPYAPLRLDPRTGKRTV